MPGLGELLVALGKCRELGFETADLRCDPAALATWPAAEAEAWGAFWHMLEAYLHSAPPDSGDTEETP